MWNDGGPLPDFLGSHEAPPVARRHLCSGGGSGGGSGSAPQFNAQQAAADQTASNVNTAVANKQLNNTNQFTPYGNLTYTKTGSQNIGGQDVPSYTATQTLAPAQQGILDQTNKLQASALGFALDPQQQAISNALKNPFDVNKAPALPTDQAAFRDQAYGDLMRRFNTDFDRTQAATDTKLRNQGLQPGTEAYNTQMDLLNRTKTDAGQQAFLQAGNLAGQNLSQAQTLHNQNLSDQSLAQSQPIGIAQQLLGQGGTATQPNYVNAPQATVNPTDVAGLQLAQYQGQMNAYNQQMQANNSMMGGLFGLGGSVLQGGTMFGLSALAGSDERLKVDIEKVGVDEETGLSLYAYRYAGDPKTYPKVVGPMAQEIAERFPDQVHTVGGVLVVNTSFGPMRRAFV